MIIDFLRPMWFHCKGKKYRKKTAGGGRTERVRVGLRGGDRVERESKSNSKRGKVTMREKRRVGDKDENGGEGG